MGNEPLFMVGTATSELPGKGWHSVYAYDPAEYHDDETDRALYRVFVQVARGDHGQLICTGLLFGGDNRIEVTARALRGIPMSALLRNLSRDDRLIGKGSMTWPAWPLNRTRAGSRGLQLRHFEEVAKGYREALQEAPRAPVKYLAERWHTPEPTIRTWLRQAREKGLLGPAMQGKAGEKPVRPMRRKK